MLRFLFFFFLQFLIIVISLFFFFFAENENEGDQYTIFLFFFVDFVFWNNRKIFSDNQTKSKPEYLLCQIIILKTILIWYKTFSEPKKPNELV